MCYLGINVYLWVVANYDSPNSTQIFKTAITIANTIL